MDVGIFYEIQVASPQAANLDLFLCMMQFWPIPHEKTMHAIDLFGKYVIPHFKKKA